MKIEKKTWPAQFDAIASGDKKFDCRLADFDCAVGDVLVLKEWNPEIQDYTGREIEKKITYILKTKETAFWTADEIENKGLQIMSLE